MAKKESTLTHRRTWHDSDISLSALQDKRIGIIGYGNQGRPQALNLADSGLEVRIGLRLDSRLHPVVRHDGLYSESIEAVAAWADVLMLLLPDEAIAETYNTIIRPNFKPQGYIGIGHGLAIDAGWLKPDTNTNTFLVAPKAQGRGVRDKFLAGSGVPALVAAHSDPAGDTLQVALAYAKALGCGRAIVLESNCHEETVCDLFSEQAVLCGGLTRLIQTAFETLVEAGFSEDTAYIECLYEVKLIGDLLHERGISGMRDAISSTARFGDLSRGHRIIDEHVKANMRHVLDDITSGRFYNEISNPAAASHSVLSERQASDYHHGSDQAFRRLQSALFPNAR